MQVIKVTIPAGIRPPLPPLPPGVLQAALAPVQEANRKMLREVFAPALREVNRSVARSMGHGIRSNPAISNLAGMQADLLKVIRKS